jgi:Na+/H+ antiporter NhaA
VLLMAAVVAMVWANSPASGAYQALWNTQLTLGPARCRPVTIYVAGSMTG